MGIHSERRYSATEMNDVGLQEYACLTIERDELHVHGLRLVVDVVAVHEVGHAVHGIGIVEVDVKHEGVGCQVALRACTQGMHAKTGGCGMEKHLTIRQNSTITLCQEQHTTEAAHSKDAHRVRGNEREWNGYRALFVASHWHQPGRTQTLDGRISNA